MAHTSDQEFAAELGSRLRQAREELGVSQEQLAKIAGLHRSTIYKIETGRRNPTASTLWSIVQSLDRPLDEITAGMEWISPRQDQGGYWRFEEQPSR